MIYYNEFDEKIAAWLRELIAQKIIPFGDVDTRSITEVRPNDVKKYRQCHFFAGIGGWAYALQLSGVSNGASVWTGSCPCQPFSCAGKQLGEKDERHLWPVFRELIRECRPTTVFGEQVASKAGRGWLCGVRTDLEEMAYAVGAADLCAACVGSPHIRQRLYWVADANRARSFQREQAATPDRHRRTAVTDGGTFGMGHSDNAGSQGRVERGDCANKWSPWSSSMAIHCADGKSRRVESGSTPLAHGVPARVVRLRGYGNAIVPQVASQFINAFYDT